jgi:dTMP kinase
MSRGRFITFEGGEGAGKTTQIRRLAETLRRLGLDVVTTREPGGSPGAEALRDVLLSGAAKPYGPFAETILFAAARDDHLEVTIRPALAAGQWVLCDRFIDSTRAYQGVLGNVDNDLIRAVERVVVAATRPDLTIVLDVPVEEGLRRIAQRGGSADRFEQEDLDFHTRLREAFLAIASREPHRCVVVDGTRSPELVEADILEAVRDRLQPPLEGRQS